MIHFINQEFILLFNYAEKSYNTNQGPYSKFDRAANYLTLYDNIGSKRVRFLIGVRYYIKNMAIKGKEEKWAVNIGFGLNF